MVNPTVLKSPLARRGRTMFRTFHRKWRRLYLTLARAWARRTTWRQLGQRDWFGKLSTNMLLLSLWLFGVALYAADAFYIRDSSCGSEAAAARYSVKEDVQTGSVAQTPPAATDSRSTEVGTKPSGAGLAPGAEASHAGSARTLPSVWGIRVIDPATLQEGWISGEYLTPKETPQVQAELPQKPAQPAAETAVSEQSERSQPAPEASIVSEQPELSQPAPDASAVSEQPEPSATPRELRQQRARWRHAPRSTFRYERGFYPTW